MKEQKFVAIYGSSATEPDSQHWRDAEMAGARCARAGLGVVTGGYGGTMEAASRGASQAGGRVIGVTAPDLFRTRFGPNGFVGQEMEARTLAERIGLLTEVANGAIVLPGSIGTAAELVMAWNSNHISRLGGGVRFPTAVVGPAWAEVCEVLTSRIGAVAADVECVDTPDEAVTWILEQPEIG